MHHEGSPVRLHSVRLLIGTSGALRIVALREGRVEAQPLLHSQPQAIFDIDCTPASSSSSALDHKLQDVSKTASCKQPEGMQLAKHLQAVNAGMYAVNRCVMELLPSSHDMRELHSMQTLLESSRIRHATATLLGFVSRCEGSACTVQIQANLGVLSWGASCASCP